VAEDSYSGQVSVSKVQEHISKSFSEQETIAGYLFEYKSCTVRYGYSQGKIKKPPPAIS